MNTEIEYGTLLRKTCIILVLTFLSYQNFSIDTKLVIIEFDLHFYCQRALEKASITRNLIILRIKVFILNLSLFYPF